MSDITHALECLNFLVDEAKSLYDEDECEDEGYIDYHYDIDDNALVIRKLIDRAQNMRLLLERRNNDSENCIACGCHNKYEDHKVDCLIRPEGNQ